eukprot:gene13140-17716_t
MSVLGSPVLPSQRSPMQRLLRPDSLAVFGGRAAAEIWPVHPQLQSVEGLPCFASVADLPGAPDASFIAVHSHATVDIVGQLAARGGGGVIAYASGFAEVGPQGAALQAQLVQAAGDMALLGPNCYG